jgi:hypothetical protein
MIKTAYKEYKKTTALRNVVKELKDREKELEILCLDERYATAHGKNFSNTKKTRIKNLYIINTNLRNRIEDVKMVDFRNALAEKHNLMKYKKLDELFSLAWDLTPYHGGVGPYREGAEKDFYEVEDTFDRIVTIL